MAEHMLRKLVVVSNRLPFVLVKNERTQQWERKSRYVFTVQGHCSHLIPSGDGDKSGKINILVTAGIEVDIKRKYRISLLPNRGTKKLKEKIKN